MRFEIIDKVTGSSRIEAVPRGLNPVRLGAHPKNNVVLSSPLVGQEMGAIFNEGKGWHFWNRNGRLIRVGAVALERLNDKAPVAHGASIVCEPLEIRVFFDEEEFLSEADDVSRLDRACNELIRDVHKRLLETFSGDARDSKKELDNAFLLQLEQRIEEEARQRKYEFPDSDREQTAVSNHLAGSALRSALQHDLLVRDRGAAREEGRVEDWRRPRIKQHEMETKLAALVDETRRVLISDKVTDLTERMAAVEADFWPYWKRLLAAPTAPSIALRYYLALRRLREEIKYIWYGLGPLEDLLLDTTISEIMVVDRDNIFIEKSGRIENSGRRFLVDPVDIINKIVAAAGRRVNTASPIVNARMGDGARLNAIIPPLALRGPCITIRRFRAKPLTEKELVSVPEGRPLYERSLTPGAMNFLRAAVLTRRNIIVAGGTGSGKTTMLNFLSGCIPDKERIITIEDTAELRLLKNHVVTLQAREANDEGDNGVSIRELVKNALRMRPDRVVVGECRGGEAIDMLQAMNTGHDGSMTTIHANSPADVIIRLEVLVQQNGDSSLPVSSIHQQIVSAVDLIVQLKRMPSGDRSPRVVTEIAEVVSIEPGGGVRIVTLFERTPGRDLRPTGRLATFAPELLRAGGMGGAVELVRME